MRILMLGNSLTSSNDLPQMLARQIGAEVVAHTRGGAHLAEHLNAKTRLGARTQEALGAGGWDAVVLQETSTGPVRSRKAYLRSAGELARQVRDAGATPVIYATWALAEGSERLAKLGLTHDEMDEALADAFAEAAHLTGAAMADVRAAFRSSESPASLYALDGVHPSVFGSALAADVIAQTIARACGDDSEVSRTQT